MAAAVFETIRDSDFGGSYRQKSPSDVQKPDSLFSDLVKNKTPEAESKTPKAENNSSTVESEVVLAEQITQSNSSETVQENLAIVPSVEEAVTAEATVTEAPVITTEETPVESVITPPLPVVEFDSSEEPHVVMAEEEVFEEIEPVEEEASELVAEEGEQETELEIEAPIIKDKETFAENLDAAKEVVIAPLEAAPVVAVEQNNTAPVVAPVVEAVQEPVIAPLDLNKLPPREQAMHQIDSSNTNEAPVIDLKEPVAKIPSKELSNTKELLSKFETPITISEKEEPKKPVVTPSLNFVLADTTERGSAVISKMQAPDNTKLETAITAASGDAPIDPEAMLSDLGGKNDNYSSRSSLPLSEFGGFMQKTSDEAFNVTFKGLLSSSQNNAPKPAEQISLAVKDVLNSSPSDGKKQITINMHPNTLGAVKVEILSQMGQDGASKVESIKISAEKNETLVMLEERKAELAKSLREVTSTKEEASLQFEMNQGQGKNQGAASFDSLEEKAAWMRQFAGVVANEGAPSGADTVQILDIAV